MLKTEKQQKLGRRKEKFPARNGSCKKEKVFVEITLSV